MSEQIDYYCAPSSPWSFFGHQRFMALAHQHDLSVDFRPVRLGGVFSETGGLPLTKRAPARQAYRLVELRRWRDFLGIPVNIHPKFFPVDDMLASLVLIHAEARFADPDALLLALYRAVWIEERDIADPAVLARILEENQADPAWAAAAIDDDETKQQLDRNTQAAIAAGVVGAPCYVYRGEPFWGQDRLDLLTWRLEQAESVTET